MSTAKSIGVDQTWDQHDKSWPLGRNLLSAVESCAFSTVRWPHGLSLVQMINSSDVEVGLLTPLWVQGVAFVFLLQRSLRDFWCCFFLLIEAISLIAAYLCVKVSSIQPELNTQVRLVSGLHQNWYKLPTTEHGSFFDGRF